MSIGSTNIEKQTESDMLYENFLSFLKESTSVSDESKTIYQYTNIEALFNGIIVKEPKADEEICLWASHCMYLNDPTEMKIGQEYFGEISNLFFTEKDETDSDGDLECFITSFSTTQDSLPMWSMYGKNGAGVALGFDRDLIRRDSEDAPLCRCVYLDEEIKDKITSIGERFEEEKKETDNKDQSENQKALSALLLLAILFIAFTSKKIMKELLEHITPYLLFIICAKHPAYRYENEVRLLVLSDKNSDIKYRYQNNLIIPYVENFFPKKALKEIWIGPTNDMDRTEKSLRSYLDSKGFADVEIHRSIAPYRE